MYPDGCVINVRSGSVVRVGAKSPCKATYSLDGQSDQAFIRNLGPFALGAALAFTGFATSHFGDDERRRAAGDGGEGEAPVSP